MAPTAMIGRHWSLATALLLSSWTHSYAHTTIYVVGNHLAFVRGLWSGAKHSRRWQLSSTTQSTITHYVDIPTLTDENNDFVDDDRPHAQRATSPRKARRLNHSFRYLYRHDDAQHNHTHIRNLSPLEFLVQHGRYTEKQVLEMNQTFPPLLDLSVKRHLWPKLRFLHQTIGVKDELYQTIPPQYYGARLERTIAPRHAFLVYKGLPHGMELLQHKSTSTMLEDFLISCRRTKQFCSLCNCWKRPEQARITPKEIEAFDFLFQRGLLAAARDELCQSNDSWPLQHVNISSANVISLLLRHGANPLELDVRGTSLLHWAAGCGNLGAVQVLFPYFENRAFTKATRDGATPFHWAAAGANAREFGCGGHLDVCQFLLKQSSPQDARLLVNQVTKDGNSVLMWAAWSGTLEVVKLLVRNRADATLANRNGCTVAHWAASGGSLPVCQYLAETVGVDFTEPNHGGNTPLTHAVAFGRTDVVEWLRNDICADEDDYIAAELAAKFVGWTDGDHSRKEVFNLFADWFGQESTSAVDNNKYYMSGTDDIEIGSC
jgi:ankyrin repeat protein